MQLSRSILQEDAAGIQQVVMYDEGVGTSGGIDQYTGGYFGIGLEMNIKQLYTFLALNYDDGDEIYLFGYSRGAFTVRSLAGLLHCCGLVRRNELDFVQEAFDLYRSNSGAESDVAKTFRQAHGGRVSIKMLACFDTVAALGLPKNMFGIKIPASFYKQYQFHDIIIHEEVEHAIHLLSLDEDLAGKFNPSP